MKKNKIIEALSAIENLITLLDSKDQLNADYKNSLLASTHALASFVEDNLEESVSKTKLDTKSKQIRTEDLIIPDEAIIIKAYCVYSDGACRGNPGPGAYGIVGQSYTGEVLFTGAEYFEQTTNNRMELLGAIKGLEKMIRHLAELKMPQNTPVFLYTDSRYVVDGSEKWLANWKARNWKKADNKEPENIDLWKNFDFIMQKFKDLRVRWVKGHNGHPQNEMCDQLANAQLDQNQ